MATSTSRSFVKLMGMYLKDPFLPDLHDNWSFPTDEDFFEGTGTSKIFVRDSTLADFPLYPGLDWAQQPDLSFEYFTRIGAVNSPQFHQVNAFAVASHTLAFVEREWGRSIIWRSGGPLVIRPHAFGNLNAFYDPRSNSLNYGYIVSPLGGQAIWTCLSHDIVAHELGHAVMNSFRPLYLSAMDSDTPALMESLCDLLAIFSALEHKDVVAYLYRDTKGNMRRPNLVSQFGAAVGHGTWVKPTPFIRSALSDLPYHPSIPLELHSRSTIWTSAIYEILVQLVNSQRSATVSDFSTAVTEASKWVTGMIFRAFHYMPPTNITMRMLSRLIYEADVRVFPTDHLFRDIAKSVFEKRNLWDPHLVLTAPPIGSEVEKVSYDKPESLARVVMAHAADLRIPLRSGARLLTPRLITTNRRVDKVRDEQENVAIKSITEHYLMYAYEIMTPVWQQGQIVMMPIYQGGTLALDENWNTILLTTYPEVKA